jgi:hypothetical protein
MHQDNKENNIDHRCRKDFELKERKKKSDIFNLQLVALVENNRKGEREKNIHNVSNDFGY